MAKLCTNCGFIGDSKKVTRGSLLIEFALWSLFFASLIAFYSFVFIIIPALLYSVWRLSSRYDACPECKKTNMIPEDSPVALKFISEHADAYEEDTSR